MPRPDRRHARLAGLLLLAGCSNAALPPAPTQRVASVPGMVTACQAGPGGGPLQADRGIGGTGAPSVRQADRGIGGTGIIGVITGFASVCLGGHEVAYDPAVPVAIDDHAAAAADLRAGQVAAVEAFGPEADLLARRMAIRHEVIGPVEAAEAPGLLRVAGQIVAITAFTLGDLDLQPGEWVAVSGFRDPDGIIHATRLDRRPAGDVELRGLLQRDGRIWRVGTLEIRFSPALRPVPGSLVLIEGHEAAGVLYADSLLPDAWETGLSGMPPLFGGHVDVVVIETFAGYSDGRLVIGRNRRDRGNAEVQRSVIELERRPDGSLQPSRFRTLGPASSFPRAAAGPSSGPANGADRHFEPAPVPARGLEQARGRSGGAQGGQPNRAARPGARGADGSGPASADTQANPNSGLPGAGLGGGLGGGFGGGLGGGFGGGPGGGLGGSPGRGR